MKLFADTEFNGHGGELISFALVPEDDRHESLYIVLDYQTTPTEWVQQNVIPQLGTNDRYPRSVAAYTLMDYLRGFSNPVIIADWPEDLVQIMMLTMLKPGEMVDLPDVTLRYVKSNFKTAKFSKKPHNALADAECLKNHMMSTIFKYYTD